MARRTIAAVAVGVLAVVGLGACRQEPGSAAYVGSTRYSDAQVRQTANEVASARLDLTDPAGIAQLYVLRDVARKLTQEKGWTSTQPITAEQVAGVQRVSANSRYATLRAEVETYLNAIRENAPPAKPTSADLHELYDRAKAAGLIPPGQTFEAVSPQFDSPELEAALGQRAALLEEIKRTGVSISPRYPAEYPLLSFQSGKPAIVLPLNSTPVVPGVTSAPSQAD
jgi:hypothetical protein